MTRSNIWALIIGGVAAGGVLSGAAIWQRNHPDTPAIPPIAKLTAPPSLNPPKDPSPKSSAAAGAVSHPDTGVKAPESEGAALVKGPPPQAEAASGHGEPPHFDVVRVEPSGDTVLAGKGDPNAKISLMASGKVLSETKSDPTGHFVLIPPTLKPGDYDLSLRQTPDGKGASDSKQTIAVSVPPKPNGNVVVALAEPGKPTKVLSGAPEAKSADKPAAPVANAPPPATAPSQSTQTALAKPETAVAPPAALKPHGPDLAIRSVELENGNGFFASGVAPTGTHVQLYLNDSHLAEVTVGGDHQWSVRVKRGLAAGHYIVRADASGAGRMVTARVEVPFDVPEAMAAKPPEPPQQIGQLDKPPPDVAARLPHDAPPAKPPPPAAATASEPPPELGTLTKPPADVAARLPHDAPPAGVAKPEEPADGAAKDAGKSSPSVVAGSTPPEPPAMVPTPRPDVAAAAKAKSAAAPSAAPPVLAVAPPTPPEARPTPPPAKMAVSPPRPEAAPPTIAATPPTVAPPTPSAANAVIEAVETVKVVRGDNLWNISRDRLGVGYRYTRIYEANTDQIRDPKLIYPGQVFVMPSGETK